MLVSLLIAALRGLSNLGFWLLADADWGTSPEPARLGSLVLRLRGWRGFEACLDGTMHRFSRPLWGLSNRLERRQCAWDFPPSGRDWTVYCQRAADQRLVEAIFAEVRPRAVANCPDWPF